MNKKRAELIFRSNIFESFSIKIENFFSIQFPNPRAYPILKNCLTAIDLYSSLDDNHDLKKARQALIKHIGKHFIILKTQKKFFLFDQV
jgi:hypothetical protein